MDVIKIKIINEPIKLKVTNNLIKLRIVATQGVSGSNVVYWQSQEW